MGLREIVYQPNIVNKWIALTQCKSGEVLFSAEFIPIDTVNVTSEAPVATVVRQESPKPENIKAKTPEVTDISRKPEEVPRSESVEKVVPLEPLPKGSIKITVHKARDLEKKGKFGKADPYAMMKIGKDKFKSGTIKNNQNPEWNYDIKFDITSKTTDEVTLEVFDEDIGKDDLLGQTQINLREIVHKTMIVNKWIALKKCKTGEVLFSAEFIPFDSVNVTPEIPASTIVRPKSPKLETTKAKT